MSHYSWKTPFLKKRNQAGRSLLLLSFLAFVLVTPVVSRQIPRFRIGEEKARDYFQKGLVFYNTQKYIAAREFFYKALNIQPYFHLARRYLGDSYYYSGDWNGALEQWEFLDELSSGNYPLVRQRSNTLRFFLNRYSDSGEYTYYRSFDRNSWGGKAMKGPVDLATGKDASLWILSHGSGELKHIDQNGELLRSISGGYLSPFQGPLSFAITEDRIYVSDYSADQVRVLDHRGKDIMTFGGPGNGPGLFRGPAGIAVMGDRILVADTGNGRIQSFRKDGSYSALFGGEGLRFYRPFGLLWDGESSLYVSDVERSLIYEYDMDGNEKSVLGAEVLEKPRGLSIANDRLIVSDETKGVLFYNRKEKRWSELPEIRNDENQILKFNRPYRAVGGNDGILYIADYGADRVDMLIPRGLRTSNLDVKVSGVVSDSYPEMALFLTVRNRLGRSLTGLKRSNFIVYENDRRSGLIRTDNMDVYNKRLNLVVAKENSDLFREHYDSYIPSVMKWILDPIRVSDRVQVVRIGETVRTVYDGLERKKLISELVSGETVSDPNTGKGLFESITALMPELGPRHVVLLVSGNLKGDPFHQYSSRRLSQYALAHGIRIHVISFEDGEDDHERNRSSSIYRSLAQDTGGNYIRAFDESSLGSLYDRLLADKDKRYIVTYKSLKDKNLRGRYMDVRVEVRHLDTVGTGEGGYFVP